MSAQAIIEGWNVPLEKRPKVVEEVLELAFNSKDENIRMRAAQAALKTVDYQIRAAQLKIAQDMAPNNETTMSLVEEMEKRDDSFLSEESDNPHTEENS